MPLELYPHQARAVDSIFNFWNAVPYGHPVLEAPTAAGKSLIQAECMQRALTSWPRTRIMSTTHVRELVEQNYLELMGQWETGPAGIYSAGMKRRDTCDPIIFSSIQSVHNRALEFGHTDLLFIDEAHLCPVKTSTGMYRAFIDAMLKINPALKVVGLTATPYRLDNGWLTHGDNALFTDVIPAKANGMAIADLLAGGFVSPLTNEPVRTGMDTSGVKKAGGDFVARDLAAAIDVDHITQAAVDEIVAFGQSRKSWLVFAISIEHAHHIAQAMRLNGILAEVVTGKTPKAERAQIIDRFKRGQLRCIINVNCLTTGFNARGVDLLAFMRPTESPALYVQMAGRGLRLSPETGKTDCLVLDFAGLIDRHGPITDVKEPKNKDGKGNGEAPVRECEQCYMLIPASVRECPHCGFIPEVDPTPAISTTASTTDIMGAALGKYNVSRMTFSKHKKDGKPDSMRVDYWEGFTIIATEWVCLFHTDMRSKSKSRQWWRRHLPQDKQEPFPIHIEEAVTRATQWAFKPSTIRTAKDGRYTSVVSKIFGQQVAAPEPAPNKIPPPLNQGAKAFNDSVTEMLKSARLPHHQV